MEVLYITKRFKQNEKPRWNIAVSSITSCLTRIYVPNVFLFLATPLIQTYAFCRPHSYLSDKVGKSRRKHKESIRKKYEGSLDDYKKLLFADDTFVKKKDLVMFFIGNRKSLPYPQHYLNNILLFLSKVSMYIFGTVLIK